MSIFKEHSLLMGIKTDSPCEIVEKERSEQRALYSYFSKRHKHVLDRAGFA